MSGRMDVEKYSLLPYCQAERNSIWVVSAPWGMKASSYLVAIDA